MGYNDGMDEYININVYRVLSVEDEEDKGKAQLKFVYEHRKTGEEEERSYLIQKDKKGRYIKRNVISEHFSENQIEIRCDLVEGQEQFEERLNTYKKDEKNEDMIDFRYCIFYDSEEITFKNIEFKKNASFSYAIFRGKSDFLKASFGGVADFRGANFGGVADFRGASFGERASFSEANFGGEVKFLRASFGKPVNFSYAIFRGKSVFLKASFGGEAYFIGANFSGNAYFYPSTDKTVYIQCCQ